MTFSSARCFTTWSPRLGYSVTKVAHGLPSALNEISENFDGALVNIGIDDQKHGNDIADILLKRKSPSRS